MQSTYVLAFVAAAPFAFVLACGSSSTSNNAAPTSTTTSTSPTSTTTGTSTSGVFPCPTVGYKLCPNDQAVTADDVTLCNTCNSFFESYGTCIAKTGYLYVCDPTTGQTEAATAQQESQCESQYDLLDQCLTNGVAPPPPAGCGYTISGAQSATGPCVNIDEPEFDASEGQLNFTINLGSTLCSFNLGTTASLSSSYTAANVVSASCSYDGYVMNVGSGSPTTGSFTLDFTTIGTSTTDASGDVTWADAKGTLNATLVSNGTVTLVVNF